MAEVKWIKIVTDIFDDEKILLIESLPSADSIIVIWFKLLCLAGKNNNSGVFLLNDKIAYTDEMLATIFRREVNTVRLALKTFEQYGMVEIVDDVITIPNWSKHQNLDQLENKRAYMREYMQDRRAKQKELIECKTNCKVNSKTNGKANVSSLDKDIDKELDKDKDKKEKKLANAQTSYFDNDDLNNTFLDFIKMRKSLKNGAMTERAITMMVSKLNKYDTQTAIEMLNNSIMNNWKDVYELKNPSQKSGQQKSKNKFNAFPQRPDPTQQEVEDLERKMMNLDYFEEG